MAVVWSSVVAFGVSFVRNDSRLITLRLENALATESVNAINAAATCAAAGIIVGVVTLTGVGLKC